MDEEYEYDASEEIRCKICKEMIMECKCEEVLGFTDENIGIKEK